MVDFLGREDSPILISKPISRMADTSVRPVQDRNDVLLEWKNRRANNQDAIDTVKKISSGSLKCGLGHRAAISNLLATLSEERMAGADGEQTRFSAGVIAEAHMAERNLRNLNVERAYALHSNYGGFFQDSIGQFESLKKLFPDNMIPKSTKAEPPFGGTTSASPESQTLASFRNDPNSLKSAAALRRFGVPQGQEYFNQTTGSAGAYSENGPNLEVEHYRSKMLKAEQDFARALRAEEIQNLGTQTGSPHTLEQDQTTGGVVGKTFGLGTAYYKLKLLNAKAEFDFALKTEQIKAGVQTQLRTCEGVTAQVIQNMQVERIKGEGQILAGFAQAVAESAGWQLIASLNVSHGAYLGVLGLNFTPFAAGGLPRDFNQLAVTGRGDLWALVNGKWTKVVDFKNMLITAYAKEGVMDERIDELTEKIVGTYKGVFEQFYNRNQNFDFIKGGLDNGLAYSIDDAPYLSDEQKAWAKEMGLRNAGDISEAIEKLVLGNTLGLGSADEKHWLKDFTERPNHGSLFLERRDPQGNLIDQKEEARKYNRENIGKPGTPIDPDKFVPYDPSNIFKNKGLEVLDLRKGDPTEEYIKRKLASKI